MLAEFAAKLFMRGHARYEAWCTRAVLGDLSVDQMVELSAHLAKCERCRTFMQRSAQMNLQVIPAVWESRKTSVSVMPPEGMRARFLQRLQQGEAEVDERQSLLELDLPLETQTPRKLGSETADVRRTSPTSRFYFPAQVAASILVAGALFAGGYYVRARRNPGGIVAATGPVAAVAGPQPAPAQSGSPDEHELLLRSVLADLNRERAAASAERRGLAERLAASDARLFSLQQQEQEIRRQMQSATREANDELESLRKERDALRQKLAEKETLLALRERRTQEIENELQAARNGMQAEYNQRVAKGQLSELVTARNLHIVDVYDADGGGNRKTSFGRVFYVEGKSLLFYAYDLQDSRHAKANIVFHVWGGRAGAKEVTHSLGLLRNEDASPGLWTMTFDDSAVLAQINSVFVTAESAGRRDDTPHGKRILYAYIGNPPNHP